MFWRIESFPRFTHHVFLSHSREDHKKLVMPVARALLERKIMPWIDSNDYSYGRDSRSALKDGLLRTRHTVFFVTDSMLTNTRGWCVLELAYAELLQNNLHRTGGTLLHQILPLFFVPRGDERVPRSVWQFLKDRAAVCGLRKPVARLDWAVKSIEECLGRERALAEEFKQRALNEPILRRELGSTPGLLERVTRFHPAKIPPQ